MPNITQIKTWVIEQVLWAEKNLKGKTGSEKKAAVIKKLDELIKLPFYLEWVDDIIISYLVDAVCSKLNEITQHDFSNLTLNEAQEIELAEDLQANYNANKVILLTGAKKRLTDILAEFHQMKEEFQLNNEQPIYKYPVMAIEEAIEEAEKQIYMHKQDEKILYGDDNA